MRRPCNDCQRSKTLKSRGLCSACWDRRDRTGTLADAPSAWPAPVLDDTVIAYLKLAAQGHNRQQAAEIMGMHVNELELAVSRQQREGGIRGAVSVPTPQRLRITPPPGWRDPRAACRGEDPGLFHAPDGEKAGVARDYREAAAKAICGRCPIIDGCLEWALATGESGIWAATTDEERAAELDRRKRKPLARVA